MRAPFDGSRLDGCGWCRRVDQLEGWGLAERKALFVSGGLAVEGAAERLALPVTCWENDRV